MVFIESYLHYTMFIVFFALAVHILRKNPDALLNKLVFLLLLSFSFFGMVLAIIQNPYSNERIANIAVHFSIVFTSAYGVLIFLSMLVFSGKTKLSSLLVFSIVAYMLITIGLQLSGYFAYLSNRNIHYGYWHVKYKNETILLILNIIHNTLVIIGFVSLNICRKRTNEINKKKQADIIFFTGLISYTLASANVYIPYIFKDVYFPVYTDLFLGILALGIIHSINRYEMFEITPSGIANQIIDMLPVGLILTNHNYQIARVNDALLSITKRRKYDYVNRSLEDVLFRITNENIPVIQTDEYTNKFRIEIPGNAARPVLWITRKMKNEYEQCIGTISIINDISLLEETENQLRRLNATLEQRIEEKTHELRLAKERAEENNRLKTAFLSNISHEFRTPMNGILGFTDLLVSHDRTDNERTQYAKIIRDSCFRLLDIIADTIEISQIQSNAVIIEKGKCNLKEILNEIINNVKADIEKKGLEFKCEIKRDEEDLFIESDCRKIFRSIKHLLDNAMKFTHTGFVKLKYCKSGNYIHISVSDSGIGISKEMQKKVFDPFRQVDYNYERSYGGNGIGLSLVKSYIEMLGGTVRIESAINKGSTVYLSIPANYSS